MATPDLSPDKSLAPSASLGSPPASTLIAGRLPVEGERHSGRALGDEAAVTAEDGGADDVEGVDDR